MGRKKLKNITLLIIAGLLLITAGLAIYADVLLAGLYSAQRDALNSLDGATPVPVIERTAAPTLAPVDATPSPTRAPLSGDISGVNFPTTDTGIRAEYSYQSDELKIAVNKVQEDGVTYYVADIWMRNISCFRTAFSSGKYKGRREDAEKISRDNNAILAVNGDFLGGLAIRNGVLYQKAILRDEPTPTPTGSPTPYVPLTPVPTPPLSPTPTPKPRPERATCVLYQDGRLVTEEYKTFRSVKAMEQGAWQGWQFGPTLVRNGEPVDDVKPQGRNPRCMIGYYEPGHYCIVMIDGRKKDYSIGMNFEEMMDLAVKLGLKEAYNLDGGGSAIMTFNGRIINQPAGKGDARKLPDMVVIGEYTSPELLCTPVPTPTTEPAATPAGTP